MAAIKLSERERTLVFLTLGALVFYVFFQYLLVPKWDEINALKSRTRDQRLELKVAEGKMRILEALEKRLGGAPEKTVIPKEERALEALKNISHASAQSGLSLISIQPVIDSTKDGFTFNLSCTGTYRSLYKFLIVLQRRRVLIFIDDLEIANKGETDLNVRMVLTAYY